MTVIIKNQNKETLDAQAGEIATQNGIIRAIKERYGTEENLQKNILDFQNRINLEAWLVYKKN